MEARIWNKSFISVFIANALLALGQYMMNVLISLYADSLGATETLVGFAVSAFACSFIVISQSSTLWQFLIAAAISAFGYGAAGPMLQACCMKSVPPERRGVGSGAYCIGVDLGNLVGPAIAGAVAESIGYQDMWLVMLAPIGLAFVLAIAFRRRIAQIDAGIGQA